MAETKSPEFVSTGRRKTSVARVRLAAGSGKMLINGRTLENYFLTDSLRGVAMQALALTESLTATQSQVEQRLAGWAQDLDRAAELTKARIAELGQRQKQLLSEVELRLAADADRLSAESEEQRAAVQRMRAELEKALEETLAAAHAEVESHAVERRRALNELEERMRHRERELVERIEREESDVAARIRSGFQDVERRQVEQLERIVKRAAATYSDEAALQFSALVKASREDAARRSCSTRARSRTMPMR